MALPLSVLASSRLRLRAIEEKDVDAYFGLCSDPVVMRYWSHAPYTERKQAEDKVAELIDGQREKDQFVWAITEPGKDTMIGTMSLFAVFRDHKRCDVGYSLAPAAQGKGYATEALRMALVFAFDTLGFERIEADIDPRNTASRALVERVGFKLEGTLRARWRVAGEICDASFYGLLKDELIR